MIVASLAILTIACQKDVSGDVTLPPGVKPCLLTRVIQGTGTDDTVYHIKYDTLDRIAVLIDSTENDSLVATYTGSKKFPDRIADDYGAHIDIAYNSKNKPLTIAGSDYGTKIDMEYVADTLLSKATEHWYDGLANAWKLAGHSEMSFDKGNLVQIKEYNTSSTLIRTLEISYTGIPNPFKELATYNFFNMLGMDDIFPAFMFLHQSKYLPKAIRDGNLVFEISYQQNAANQVISSVAVLKNTTNNNIEYTATRHYFYTCP